MKIPPPRPKDGAQTHEVTWSELPWNVRPGLVPIKTSTCWAADSGSWRGALPTLGRGTGFFSYISAQENIPQGFLHYLGTSQRDYTVLVWNFFYKKTKIMMKTCTYTFIFLFNFSTSPTSSTIRIQLGVTLYLPGNNVTLSLGLAWKLPVACLWQAVMVMGVTYPSGSFFFNPHMCHFLLSLIRAASVRADAGRFAPIMSGLMHFWLEWSWV